MASISNQPGGKRTVQFMGLDGKRRSIRLGKTSKAIAETVSAHVQAILNAADAGITVDPKTTVWLSEIGDELHSKLAKVGLVHPRGTESSLVNTVAALVQRYRDSRSHLKGGTRQTADYGLQAAEEFFGGTAQLNAITPGDCDRFATWLTVTKKLAPATAGRRLRTVKGLFRFAVRHELLVRNPADGIKEGSQANPNRQHFVDRATVQRILDACPDTEWRLLVCLARFGGLRIPSEAITLEWSAIDWSAGRLTVKSPKTEHIAGKGQRQLPLFPELRAALDDRWAVAPEGEFVFDRLQRTVNQSSTGWNAVNLRTQFTRILRKAGVPLWPRLWVNLRSSCETELVEKFPAHVAARWLGHTPDVAQRHYLQVVDAAFNEASGALQKAVQIAPESAAPDAHRDPGNAKTPCFQGVSESGDYPARIRT
jgi:integrase